MKYSIYNTYLRPTSKTTIIYNALTDYTVCVPTALIENQEITTLPLSVRDKFMASGMIVQDDVDEYANYVKYALEEERMQGAFHMLINPTLNCNFKCWYCYESHIPSKMNEDTIERIKCLIDRIYRKGEYLTISFFGGEPMLYYTDVMLPIISYAQSEARKQNVDFNCNMTSNGFLLDNKKIERLKELGFTGAQITLDGNKETHNKVRCSFEGQDSFTTIVNNIKTMVRNGMSVTLRINCSWDNLDGLSEIPLCFSDLSPKEKSLIYADLQVVWQVENRWDLYRSLEAVMSAFNNRGILSGRMDFRGFCYGDKRNSCLVNYNGDIFKCTAVDFVKVKRDGYISKKGEIVWEEDSLEKRMASKFRNEPCKTCRIFPLCHGGCTKQSLQSTRYCVHNHNDEEKDEVVKNRVMINAAREKLNNQLANYSK